MKLFIVNKRKIYNSIIIILIALIIIGGYLYFSKTREVFNEQIYYKGSREEKIVAFTCNIDWGNEYIDEMLKIFADKDIKITFFPTGRWSENNREVLSKIHEEGHEIGNHGYKHLDYDKLDYKANFEQINTAHTIIEEIIQDSPKYFAPPSGGFNEYTIQAAEDLGYQTILWSVDTIDWRDDSHRDLIVKRVVENIHNSAIVLMHPTAETNKALPIIIKTLYENGYRIGTISDVI